MFVGQKREVETYVFAGVAFQYAKTRDFQFKGTRQFLDKLVRKETKRVGDGGGSWNTWESVKMESIS